MGVKFRLTHESAIFRLTQSLEGENQIPAEVSLCTSMFVCSLVATKLSVYFLRTHYCQIRFQNSSLGRCLCRCLMHILVVGS